MSMALGGGNPSESSSGKRGLNFRTNDTTDGFRPSFSEFASQSSTLVKVGIEDLEKLGLMSENLLSAEETASLPLGLLLGVAARRWQ